MKPRLPSILLALLILSACSPAQLSTPIVNPTPLPQTATPLTPAVIPPTETPIPAETAIPQLSARSTFEVIAAMRAYLLVVEEYVAQDLSPAEEQAVLSPIFEFGIIPIGSLLDLHNPDPHLETEWKTAIEIFQTLHLSSSDWNTIPDQVSQSAEEMIGSAIIVAKELGVDTTQYGEDYAGAIEAANALLPEIAVQPLPESPARGEPNPELIPVQITPFVFDFAGSEVFYTIGTIENTSSSPQTNVTIEVSYFNFLDEHIVTVEGRLLADVANPGGVYPFIATDVIAGEEAALTDQTRYEAAVYSKPAEAESYQAFDVSLPLQSILEVSGEYHLTCEIIPSSDPNHDLKLINVGVAVYDASDNLVGVGGGTYLVEDPIFVDIVIQVLAGEPARYQFFAEAVE